MRNEAHDDNTGHLSERVRAWWLTARDRWRQIDELHRLPSTDLEQMASETGMSAVEFLRLAASPDGLPRLLARRLSSLKLNPEEIRRASPVLLADLARVCNNCPDKRQCRHDFDAHGDATGLPAYCLNSSTLAALREQDVGSAK